MSLEINLTQIWFWGKVKGMFTPKCKFYHNLLALLSFQTCMTFFWGTQKNVLWRMTVFKISYLFCGRKKVIKDELQYMWTTPLNVSWALKGALKKKLTTCSVLKILSELCTVCSIVWKITVRYRSDIRFSVCFSVSVLCVWKQVMCVALIVISIKKCSLIFQ